MDESKKKSPRKLSIGTKRGVYTAAVSAIVVAIVIVFNLLVGSIPSGTLEYDMSGKDLYTVTEQSVDYLKKLDKDVDVVVLAQSSVIDQHLLKFINNYAKLSSHIKLQIIDPVLDPTALTTYSAKENNVVITCTATGKSKTLSMAGVQGYQDGLILYDAQTLQYYNQYKAVALDAEGQLTSAVGYVTSTTANKLYTLTGHGEAALGTTATSYIAKANISTASLNLLTDGGVPDGCQLLLCVNPTKDLTGDELTMLKNYLTGGGKLLLLLDNASLKNFNALLAVYGLAMKDGLVGDNTRSYLAYAKQYGVYCIYPVLSTSSDVTSNISADTTALLRYSKGMAQVTAERRNAVETSFMTTSEQGVLQDTSKKTTTGQYILGATVTETFTDKPTLQTRLTVISAVDLISDQIDTNFANMTIFMNAVSKNFNDAQSVSIPSKSLAVSPTTIGQNVLWAIALVGVIPFVILGGGVYTWVRRRNR